MKTLNTLLITIGSLLFIFTLVNKMLKQKANVKTNHLDILESYYEDLEERLPVYKNKV
jgi:hypothetical protein